MVALIAVVISFLLFRPVAAAFAAGELNNRVALLFFLHAIGGRRYSVRHLFVGQSQAGLHLPAVAGRRGGLDSPVHCPGIYNPPQTETQQDRKEGGDRRCMKTCAVLYRFSGVTGGEITTMWVIMALLVVFSFIATRNLKERPGKLQNVAETIVEKTGQLLHLYIGQKACAALFPAAGHAVYLCHCMQLFRPVPGCRVLRFMPPTSSSVTAGFFPVVFIGLQMAVFRELGVKGFLPVF